MRDHDPAVGEWRLNGGRCWIVDRHVESSSVVRLRSPVILMKATWNNTTIAETDDTVVVEGNHYFPPESVKQEFLQPSTKHTTCPWKGEASYYDVVVNGEVNGDAAWYYPDPKPAAGEIKDRIAFWRGVTVDE